ncbi:MAG: hypothetical protein GY787_31015 [Alteromonadales bacterium]|nr:hypothetical protein [Alteromonadales bacterium]
MRKNIKLISIIILISVILTGCQESIYNVENSPITIKSELQITNDDIFAAIKKAGHTEYWEIKRVDENNAIGTFYVRVHQAIVAIKFNTDEYSIRYKDGTNLTFQPEDGTIHNNYNKWVKRLEKQINFELALIK